MSCLAAYLTAPPGLSHPAPRDLELRGNAFEAKLRDAIALGREGRFGLGLVERTDHERESNQTGAVMQSASPRE